MFSLKDNEDLCKLLNIPPINICCEYGENGFKHYPDLMQRGNFIKLNKIFQQGNDIYRCFRGEDKVLHLKWILGTNLTKEELERMRYWTERENWNYKEFRLELGD